MNPESNNGKLTKTIEEKLVKVNQIIEYNHLRTHYLEKDELKFQQIKDFINQEGRIIYKSNEFFRDLHNLMKNEEFKKFYNKYFTNWFDIELMTMYMKLYDAIKTSYEMKHNEYAPYSLILFMLKQVIVNNETRQIVLENFKKFKKGVENNKFKKIKKLKRLKFNIDKELEDIQKI